MLALPLTAATRGSHWSLIRSRKHHPSDIVADGAIALVVAAVAWMLRPPGRLARHSTTADARRKAVVTLQAASA